MKARIIVQENVFDIDNNLIESGLQLQVEMNDRAEEWYYQLTSDDLTAVTNDTSGNLEAIKTIASRELKNKCDAMKAEDGGETIKVDRNPIDLTSTMMIVAFILLAVGMLYVVARTAEAPQIIQAPYER